MHDSPFAAPEAPAAPTTAPSERARGGCLTAFLALMMIVNPLVSAIYLLGSLAGGIPGVPGWALIVLGVGGLANFAGALAVWNWKRWGVALVLVMAVVAMGVNLTIGVPPQSIVTGLLGPVILVGLVYSRWEMFD